MTLKQFMKDISADSIVTFHGKGFHFDSRWNREYIIEDFGDWEVINCQKASNLAGQEFVCISIAEGEEVVE